MIQLITPSRYKINRKELKKTVSQILLEKGVNESQTLNIIFIGRTKMKQVSSAYKDENVALPVLSFPYNEQINGQRLIGEIFICYPQAVLLAAQKNKRVDAMITQLVEHGIENLTK